MFGSVGAPTSASLLGPASSGSLFGAAASTPTLFSSPSTPANLFGATGSAQPQASSQSLFGQSSASLFAGGPPGQQASASLLGASAPQSSASLFGAAQSSASLFGAAQSSASLFGAAQSSASLFGAAQSAPSLFGPTTAAPQQSSASLFGGGTSSSLFPAAGGLFKGAAAYAPGTTAAATGGLFAPSANRLFPAAATGAPAASSSSYLQDLATSDPTKLQQLIQEQHTLFKAIKDLDDSLAPGSAKYQLVHLFLYVVSATQRVRPPNVPEAVWQAALRRAEAGEPGLWPVAIQGLQQLNAHREAQTKAVERNQAYCSELEGVVQALGAQETHDLRSRVSAVLDRHVTLAYRLLKVIRMVDALEARATSAAELVLLDQKLLQVSQALRPMEAELVPTNSKGLKHKVQALAANVDMQVQTCSGVSAASMGISGESLQEGGALLAEYNKCIKVLQSHLRKCARDVRIVETAAETASLVTLA